MLRNIPPCLSPDLIHALMSMGHGDEIVLADADFPFGSNTALFSPGCVCGKTLNLINDQPIFI